MSVWDIVVTLTKVFLMACLSYIYGSHFSGVLLYALLVALPLIVMRWSAGFNGSGISFLLFALVGMDSFYSEKAEV